MALGTLCTYCLGREAAVAAAAEPGLAPGELLRNHGGQAVPASRLEDQVPFLHALVSCLTSLWGFNENARNHTKVPISPVFLQHRFPYHTLFG